MNYRESLDYIHSIECLGSKPGLSRTQELMRRLGNPERDLKFIHVTGTNGKGSTCAMLSSVLCAAGYRVGLYTSPFVVRFEERMCIDGEPISEQELAELTSAVRPIAESMEEHPTEFELVTAISFLYYKRHSCDAVVLEVGRGGRGDSTNVIPAPLVSVITGIALDHTEVLGGSITDIAREKSGIIKSPSPAVYGGRDGEAFSVIKAYADKNGCELTRTRLDELCIKSMSESGTVFDYGDMSDIELSLCGAYQVENAATVIETIRALNRREAGFSVSEEAIRAGPSSTVWHARFELLAKNPAVVFDGSHNIQGVTAAVDSARAFFGDRVNILMGVLADKDFTDMARLISGIACRVFCVTPLSPRALSSKKLSEVFSSLGVESKAFESIEEGVFEAYRASKAQDVPLLMLGSLYMYGDAYFSFKKAQKTVFRKNP